MLHPQAAGYFLAWFSLSGGGAVALLITEAAAKFLTTESKFVQDLFQAAEVEVRSTERWLLIALGAIYSYLATKARTEVPQPLRKLAWYSPTFIVVFAGIRAFGLGFRQWQVLNWLAQTETSVLGANGGGWAQSKHPWIVTATATGFYVILALATFIIARLMSRPENSTG